MSAIVNLVTSICLQTPGNYNQACSKAIDAGSQQSGVTNDLNYMERSAGRQARLLAEDHLGQEGVEIITGTAIVINAAATQKFIINLPTFGICNSLKTEYRPSLYKITIEWKF
jgi:hypothetical protein